MVESLRLAVGLVALSSMALITSACEGGCFSQADPVVVRPATECLRLSVGSPDDGTICGTPELEGTNACNAPLTLPPPAPGEAAQLVAAGSAVRYAMSTKSPGIRLNHREDDTDWIIGAALGDQQLAITVSIHEK